jgi:Xaa-Pro aminopeptidase
MTATPQKDPYFVDCPKRVARIQEEMAKEGLDLYLGTRLRTISWVSDVFNPQRCFVVIPAKGTPTLFTFVIDAARVAEESWLGEDNVLGYAPVGGMDQITQISTFIREEVGVTKGRIGVEIGMCQIPTDGTLTYMEYVGFEKELDGCELVSADHIMDRVTLIKDEGTINRIAEASRIVDIGHYALKEEMMNGGWKGMTETVVSGVASLAMRRAGSEWEWAFTGGNEIAAGHRSGYAGGACTPPTRRELVEGDPLMVDLHAMFMLGLGDHSRNYFIGKPTKRQRWHADNFVAIVSETLKSYRAGISVSGLAVDMIDFANERGFADYMVPGFEHGIGLEGDEWKIGMNDGPFIGWTNPEHVYQAGEVIICAMQYACPDDEVGFRYENPILIKEDKCIVFSKTPLAVEEIY